LIWFEWWAHAEVRDSPAFRVTLLELEDEAGRNMAGDRLKQ
jgi:hypothetical protein